MPLVPPTVTNHMSQVTHKRKLDPSKDLLDDQFLRTYGKYPTAFEREQFKKSRPTKFIPFLTEEEMDYNREIHPVDMQFNNRRKKQEVNA